MGVNKIISENVTVICLTLITITEIIANGLPMISFWLWFGYGMYKL